MPIKAVEVYTEDMPEVLKFAVWLPDSWERIQIDERGILIHHGGEWGQYRNYTQICTPRAVRYHMSSKGEENGTE